MNWESFFDGAEMAITGFSYFMIFFFMMIFLYVFAEYLLEKMRGE